MSNLFICYTTPDGDRIRGPVGITPDLLLSDLQDRDDNYWSARMAVGNVSVKCPTPEPEWPDACKQVHGLLILAKEGYGYFLELIDSEPPPDVDPEMYDPYHYYTVVEGPRTDMTRIWIGQNYARILREFFVDKETAINVVKYFCETGGGRFPGVTWVDDESTAWNFYEPPEDDVYNPEEP